MLKHILSRINLDFSEIDRELQKLRDLRDSFRKLAVTVPVRQQQKRPNKAAADRF